MQKGLKIKKAGFTLVETLVAIMMVSIAFLGIYAAASKYGQQTKQIKETYIASLLGQEGIEFVRNIRDKNWVTSTSSDLPNPDFTNGLTGCSCSSGTPPTGGCEADYLSTDFSDTYDGDFLYITNGNSFYKYITSPSSSDVKTNYKRQICIDTTTRAGIIGVTVYVYWTGGRQTIVKEDLYNWKW